MKKFCLAAAVAVAAFACKSQSSSNEVAESVDSAWIEYENRETDKVLEYHRNQDSLATNKKQAKPDSK